MLLIRAGFFILLLSLSLVARTEEIKLAKPYVEAGISGGGGIVPDYPGSNQSKFRYLVFPVFHLRGKILRSDDEDGSRARLLRSTNFAFELSAAGSFPAASADNRAREGMRNLEWLGEIGPRVFAQLYNKDGIGMRASFAVRGAASTDLKAGHYRGMTFTPGFAYDHKKFFSQYLSFLFRLSPQFTTREYQAYFYEVGDRDVTPNRRAYGAKPGYIGTSITPALFWEKGNWGVFGGASVSLNDGAANVESPLFKESVNYSAFVGFRWYFYKSAMLGYL